MSDAVIMGIDDGVDTFQGELKDETQPLNYVCECRVMSTYAMYFGFVTLLC